VYYYVVLIFFGGLVVDLGVLGVVVVEGVGDFVVVVG